MAELKGATMSCWKRFLFGFFSGAAVAAQPFHANAAALDSFDAPYQITTGSDQILFISDGVFQRETYPFIAGILRLIVTPENRPRPGDTWINAVDVTFPDGTLLRAGTIPTVYDAALDCFVVNGGAHFCGVYAAAEAGITQSYTVIGSYDGQCIPKTDPQGRPFDYRFAGEFLPNGGPVTVAMGLFPFRPTPFPVGVPEVSVSRTVLHPETTKPTIAAEGTDVTVIVSDGIVRPSGGNCGILLHDIPVAIRGTIVPSTGSHKHFTSPEEPGTGKFIASPPQIVGPDGTTVSGHTDVNGQLITRYEAGLFGVAERIRVEATDQHYGRTRENETELTIRVPGLVPLDTGNAFYSLRGTFSSPCDIQHNDGAIRRRSHYVTPAMHDLVGTMAGRFFSAEGVPLSLNDASLEFGGFFDAGVRTSRCHILHRHGIDVDVNVSAPGYPACPGSSGLRCPATHPKYQGVTRRAALTEEAEVLGGTEEREATLHYRFRSARN